MNPTNVAPPLKTSAVFLMALLAFAVLLSVVYIGDAGNASHSTNDWVSWLYLPGISLYILFNGSLIFGGGFGTTGDYAIIALGSAVSWAALCALIFWLRKKLFKSAL